MPAFKHILAPLDFTLKNDAALKVISGIAEPGETRVTLMHVVEAIPCTQDDPIADFYRSLEVKATRSLAPYFEQLAALGVDVDVSVLLGRPARKIVAEAEAVGVDLVVLSSHALNTEQTPVDASWATVSYQVSTFRTCAVLLVK